MDFKRKVCVVTGGTSGIGLATTRMFAEAGAVQVVFSIDPEKSQKLEATAAERGWVIRCVVGDVGDPAAWEDVLAAAGQLGPVDVLVNNAGYGLQGTVLDLSLEQWEAQFRTNVAGVFLGCKAILPQMIKQGQGSIVNVASVAGTIGMAKRAAYCASKSAILGLTRAMAVDHAREGIRINAVAPGTTDSPYFDRIGADVTDPVEYRKYLSERQILGRMGTSDEIASAIVFLASDAASFAIGSVVTVDGGMSIW